MKKLIILLVVCTFFFINLSKSQVFTNYSVDSANTTLCDNAVHAIAIDAEGNKWFGTYGGVSKFDDTNWITYDTLDGLANNHVSSIAIDKDGNKWFGYGYAGEGVTKFDGITWTTYTAADGLVSNHVSSIAIDKDGNKWFGYGYAGEGVTKFDGITWTTYTAADGLANNLVSSIAIDEDDNKWFGTRGGVSKFDDSTWINYTAEELGLYTVVRAIAISQNNNILIYAVNDHPFFGMSGGVSKFDGTKWTTCFRLGRWDYVSAIAIDAEGIIWLGFGGVLKFDGINCWITFTTADGLASDGVGAIAIDAEGNKWFGTNGGVSKLSDDGNRTCISVSPSNYMVGSDTGNASFNISSDNNWTISNNADWLTVSPDSGSGNGTVTVNFETNFSIYSRIASIAVSKTEENSQSIITVTQEGVKEIILSVSPGNQDVSSDAGDRILSISSNTYWTVSDDADWLAVDPTDGNGNGTLSVSFNANTLAASRFATITVSGTEVDSQSVFIVTQRGIEMILSVSPGDQYASSNAGDTSFIINSNASFTSNSRWTVTDDADWLEVRPNSGVGNRTITASYTANTLTTSRIATITVYTVETTSSILLNGIVFAIATDAEGNKWFGTSEGVTKFDGITWTTYSTSDGLSDNIVRAIAIDAQGNKWFGTDRGGVSKFDDTTWTNYTTTDGLIGNSVRAVAIDAEGNKWFGTNGGVSKFDDTAWTTYTTADGLISNDVYAITIDANSNKWFGTYRGGVSKFDNTTWTTYTTADGLAYKNVHALAIDAEGNKWFGTDGGGVSKFDGTTWTTYTTSDGLVNKRVYTVTIDAEGNKWFGTANGVTKYDGLTWTTYTISVGLAGNSVYAIAIDTESNLWFGTSEGLLKFEYGPEINSQSVSVTQSGAVSVSSLYDRNITIYPNPVNDRLFIIFNDATLEDIFISVVDISGRSVIKRKIDKIDLNGEEVLDLSSMKSGLYFLEIKSNTNSTVYKIIKE